MVSGQQHRDADWRPQSRKSDGGRELERRVITEGFPFGHRAGGSDFDGVGGLGGGQHRAGSDVVELRRDAGSVEPALAPAAEYEPTGTLDRKSTRLNSSHANISYAVFCLKK